MEIIDAGSDGEGVGKIDGFTVFVENVVPGDVIEAHILNVKKSHGYAKAVRITKPSPVRVEPACAVSGKCGGCSFQAMSYDAQLKLKTAHVKACLERIGGIKTRTLAEASASERNGQFENELPVLHDTLGMENPYCYRNKAQFPVRRAETSADNPAFTSANVRIGFFAKRSHRLIDVSDCVIQHGINKEVTAVVKEFLEVNAVEPYDETTHKGLVRHIVTRVAFATGEVSVCIVINGSRLPHERRLVEMLSGIEGVCSITVNENTGRTNVIFGDVTRTLFGNGYITDLLDGIKFRISATSFYQVNPLQTSLLYKTAAQYAGLTGTETVIDAYCGIGTISLYIAGAAAHVYGVELSPQAIADAKTNARINGVKNVTFLCGKSEDVIPSLYRNDGVHADVVVLDPPRKGCEVGVIDTVIEMRPKKVVYVSCDPATLARDLKRFAEGGYRLVEATPVDMFPMTAHVETVAVMTATAI